MYGRFFWHSPLATHEAHWVDVSLQGSPLNVCVGQFEQAPAQFCVIHWAFFWHSPVCAQNTHRYLELLQLPPAPLLEPEVPAPLLEPGAPAPPPLVAPAEGC
jgi:hypothetical protein